jgi:hypothetical protein
MPLARTLVQGWGVVLIAMVLIAGCASQDRGAGPGPAAAAPASSASATAAASDPGQPAPLKPVAPRAEALAAAARIAGADHATIYRLAGEHADLAAGEAPGANVFHVQQEQSGITATRACDAATARPLLTALHDMMVAPRLPVMAECFEPAWGIDVYGADGALVFHGMFCFMCMGYHFQVQADGDAHQEIVPDLPQTTRLHDLLDRLLPDPGERRVQPAP